MQTCLGIYIDNSVIKYSKVSKEKDNIKIEASGIRFFDDLETTINQILQETNSQKLPVAINLNNENYDYIEVFSLLSKSDIKKSVNLEFEMICGAREVDVDLFENKYVMSVNRENPDKMNVMNVSVLKSEIAQKMKIFEDAKLSNISPMPTSIANLVNLKKKENCLIVNIENETTVTLVIDGQPEKVYKIEDGMNEIFAKISESENSLSKSYDVCKNITISTQDTGLADENEYLDVVMPVMYKIVNSVKRIRKEITEKTDNIYITGSGITINNIDLYFQNYFEDTHCEMLRPSFLKVESLKIPVKEYMEVNSATALALEELSPILPELNFKEDISGTKNIGGLEITGIPDMKFLKKTKKDNDYNSEEKFDAKEKLMIRILATILIFILGYSALSLIVENNFVKAEDALETESTQVEDALSAVNSDAATLKSLANSYEESYYKLIGVSTDSDETEIIKDSIPVFLQQVMYSIPEEVTLVSVENTSGTQMSIVAKSEDYEQLGLFKAILYSDGILLNVTSTSSYKADNDIYVTIIGDLPR